jgi:hypothetical protein
MLRFIIISLCQLIFSAVQQRGVVALVWGRMLRDYLLFSTGWWLDWTGIQYRMRRVWGRLILVHTILGDFNGKHIAVA